MYYDIIVGLTQSQTKLHQSSLWNRYNSESRRQQPLKLLPQENGAFLSLFLHYLHVHCTYIIHV